MTQAQRTSPCRRGEPCQDTPPRFYNLPISNYYDLSVDLKDKSLLVTGGTGSFGKRFVRTVLDRYEPRRLIIYSRDELKQYEMQQELGESRYRCLRYFIGDVRDRQRLEMAMRDVDCVVHAAALKHVPVAEYNPSECIHTNVLGAENVVHAALRCGVKTVIALSTDKAANPVNLYGASKLAADKIFVAANNLSGRIGTRFAVVRYGNVVGSRGSVIPFFQKLSREGAKSLPITDPRMTRFWITLQQGVDFVLSCMKMAKGGEIFVPKIPSMSITDLADCLAPGIPVDVIGIRPGEKLHEVLITAEEARTAVELKDRYIVRPVFKFWSDDGRDAELDPGKPVADGFVYSSDLNTDWIDADRLGAMLREFGPIP
ncbi:MAG: UDP-N-acetylglucosamine 4,6-dehydratase (inverting) [Rhodospirillales bacterium]